MEFTSIRMNIGGGGGGGSGYVGPIPLMLSPRLLVYGLVFTISSGAVSARVCDGRGDFKFPIFR